MRVVIAGCGRFGSTLAVRLAAEGHTVTIVDVTTDQLERFLPSDFPGRTILGDAIDEDVLREAGIETADAFVASMYGDNHNLMAVQIAKIRFGVSRGRTLAPYLTSIWSMATATSFCWRLSFMMAS